MASLSSVSDFREWQTALKAALDPDKKEVTICCGTGCTAFGAPVVEEAFEDAIAAAGAQDRVSVKATGCHGLCEKGPVVVTQHNRLPPVPPRQDMIHRTGELDSRASGHGVREPMGIKNFKNAHLTPILLDN